MKRWSLIRLIGVVMAGSLIIFGSVENLWRTVKYSLGRTDKD